MRLGSLIALGLVIGVAAGWWLRTPTSIDSAAPLVTNATSPAALHTAATTPLSTSATPPALRPPAPDRSLAASSSASGLLLPVQGVEPSQLRDTFTDARSEGRVHDAIDILAKAGTPVYAVTDGHVEKLFDSERGGLTLYQFDPEGRYCYYYAHLQRYADGLEEQQQVTRGQLIGYVGSTGNANAQAPHLHFEVHELGPEKHWWKGQSINPYPLLRGAH